MATTDGGRINYTIGFNVDKTGLNTLTQSLRQIQNMTVKDLVNTGSIQNAEAELNKVKKTAYDVEMALRRSFDTDLGTLNVSKFNQELKNLGINKIYTDLSKVGVAGQNAFRNLTADILTTNIQLKKSNEWLDKMGKTMSNTIRWGVTSGIWNSMTNSIQRAYGFAKSLDTSLNDIRIVTEKSADEMDRFAVTANKAAKDLGAKTTEYTNAALIYYQQGLSDEEVKARAETTLKTANVTGKSGSATSELLTSVWNGYKVNAEEAELYVDKLAAVASKTASDLDELSTGMSKVASAANLMGVDVDQLNAQLATIISVTRQAPESVGTALKTIYARMGDIEAGLDTETTLGNYTEKMAEMGVNVLDMNGKLRDMGEVIEEIGGKWSLMSREQQLALAQTMAGARQYNNLLALFDNWSMYTDAIDTSRNSMGTLQKQQDIYMESLKGHLKELESSTEGMFNALLNADDIIPLVDVLTEVVDLFKNFIDSIGGFQGAIQLLGITFSKVMDKQISDTIATAVNNMNVLKEQSTQLQAQQEIFAQFGYSRVENEQVLNLINKKEEMIKLNSILSEQEQQQGNQLFSNINQQYIKQDELNQKVVELSETYRRMTTSEENPGGLVLGDLSSLSYTQQQDAINRMQEGLQNVKNASHDFTKQFGSDAEQIETNIDEMFTGLATKIEKMHTKTKNVNKDNEADIRQMTRLQEALEKQRNKLVSDQETLGRKQEVVRQHPNAKTDKFLRGQWNAEDEVNKTKAKIEELNQKIKEYQDAVARRTPTNIMKDLQTDIEKLLQSYSSLPSTLEMVQKNAAPFKPEDIQLIQAAAEKLGGIDNILKNFAGKAEASELEVFFNEIGKSSQQFQELAQAVSNAYKNTQKGVNQQAKSFQNTTNQVKEYKIAQEEANRAYDEFIKSKGLTKKISEINSLLRSVNQLGFAIQSIQRLPDIWANNDLTFGDQLLQTIMALSTAIPMAISAMKIFNTSLGNGITLSQAYATAKAKVATETQKATMAQAAETAIQKIENTELQTIIRKKVDELVARVGTEKALTKEAIAREILATATANGIPMTVADANAIAAHTLALGSGTVAANGFTASLKALWATMIANPITLIIAAVAALVAIIATAVSIHQENMKAIRETTSEQIKAAKATYDEIKYNEELLKSYQDLYNQFEENKLSRQELYEQTIDLISGYLDEADALAILAGDYDAVNKAIRAKNKAEREERKKEREKAYTVQRAGQEGFFDKQNITETNDGKQLLTLKTNPFDIEKRGAALNPLTEVFGEENVKLINQTGSPTKIEGEQKTSLPGNYVYTVTLDYNPNDPENILKYKESLDKVQDLLIQTEEGMGGKTLTSINENVSALNDVLKDGLEQMIKDAAFDNIDDAIDIDYEKIAAFTTLKEYEDEIQHLIEISGSSEKDVLDRLKLQAPLGDLWNERLNIRNSLLEHFEGDSSVTEETANTYVEGLSKDEILQLTSVLKVEEITSMENISAAIAKAQYFADKNAIQAKIEYIQTGIDSLMEGKELTDEQLISLKKLEAEYPQLEAVQDRTSTEYLNLLTAIREEQEAMLIQQSEASLEHFIGKATEIDLDTENAEERLQKALEDVADQDYEIVVNVKADIQTDFDSVTSVMDKISEAVDRIGEGFIVAADDVEELNDAFPGILSGLQFLTDGTVKLNQEAVNAAMKTAKAEVAADTDATVQKLQNDIVELQSKQQAAQQIADIATSLAKGESKAAEKQSEINAALDQLESDNSAELAKQQQTEEQNVAETAQKSATSMAQNFSAAYQTMADESSKWAEIAKHNFNVAIKGQGEVQNATMRTWATNWQATNDDYGTVATADPAQLRNVTDLPQLNWTEVAEYYQNLANSYGDLINNTSGKVVELIASSQEVFHQADNAGLGEDEDTKDLLNDELDIYHDINIELQKITNTVEELSLVESRMIGKSLINNLKLQNTELAKQIDLMKEKQNLQYQEGRVLKGRLLGYGGTFEDDTLTNYFELMQTYQDNYNSLVIGGASDEEIDAAKQTQENLKEDIERYDTLVHEEIPAMYNDMLEKEYERMEKQIQAYNEELQIKLDAKEAIRDLNAWSKDVFDEFKLFNSDIAHAQGGFKIVSDQASRALENVFSYYSQDGTGTAELNFEKLQHVLENVALMNQKDINSDYVSTDKYNNIILNQTQAMEDLSSAQDALKTSMTDLTNEANNIITAWNDGFEAYNTKVDELMESFDDAIKTINHAAKVNELLYGKSPSASANFTQAEIDQNTRRLGAMNIQRAELNAEYKRLLEAGNDTQARIVKDSLDQLVSDMDSIVEDNLQKIQENITNRVNAYYEDLQASSLTQGEWDLAKENQNERYDRNQQILKLDALDAKIEQEKAKYMAKEQAQLTKFQNEELKRLREKDVLTKHEYERAEKRYQLLLKQIALEESQNNKIKMRLRRDSQGNYSYQYVADDEDVEDKTADIAGAREELYTFDKNYLTSMTDTLQKMLSENGDKLSDAILAYQQAGQTSEAEAELQAFLERLMKNYGLNAEDYLNAKNFLIEDLKDIYSTSGALINQNNLSAGSIGSLIGVNAEDVPNMEVSQLLAAIQNAEGGTNYLLENIYDLDGEIFNVSDALAQAIQTGRFDVESLGFLTNDILNKANQDINLTLENGHQDLDVINGDLTTVYDSTAGIAEQVGIVTAEWGEFSLALEGNLSIIQDIVDKMNESFIPAIETAVGWAEKLGLAAKQVEWVMPDYGKLGEVVADLSRLITAANGLTDGTGIVKVGPEDGEDPNISFEKWAKAIGGEEEDFFDEMYRLDPSNDYSDADQMDAILNNVRVAYAEGKNGLGKQLTVADTRSSEHQLNNIKDLEDNSQDIQQYYWDLYKKDQATGFKKMEELQAKREMAEQKVTSSSSSFSADEDSQKTKLISILTDEINSPEVDFIGANMRQTSLNNLKSGKTSVEAFLKANPDYVRKLAQFATGGYTGDTIPASGALAILHNKELVLNADDTSNMLKMIEMVRQMKNSFIEKQQGLTFSIDSMLSGLMTTLYNFAGARLVGATTQNNSNYLSTESQPFEQNVTINADFPNVTDHNEIEQALQNLSSMAAQNAFSTRR